MIRGFSLLKGMPARLAALVLLCPVLALAQAPDFIEFESGHVRPLAMSADGTRLFAVNTPNNALEIFSITASGLTLQARVPVGLEPVAVAVRSPTEVWVVNHLSDSVSVVTLTGTPRVTRTVLVGDEPRDIVFAGTNNHAFITTAHRGQHRTDASIAGVPGAGDPQLTTPGVNRADVWVFDPASLGTTLGGTPVRIVTLFGDTPRALAVSPDRRTVYAAILQSGNQTTTANLEAVCDGFITFLPCFILSDRAPLFNNSFPGGLPGPRTNAEGRLAPEVGLVVKFNRSRNRWEDTLGRNWNNAIRFRLPDKDVFAINADTLAQTAFYTGVGTTLFNMVTNPVNGRLYVTNSEAQNLTRFEGPGVFGGSTVQGNLAQMRVTVISGTSVTPRHLNKHIDYNTLATEPGFDPTTKNHSLSTPLGMAVSNDGARLYIAAFGSSKIGVLNTAALENNSFNPRTASANYINVSGGGPSGIVLDEPRNRLYVMTRFDNAVKAINLTTRAQVASVHVAEPGAGERGARPAVAVRRELLLGKRRSVVRQLPHLRRQGRAGVGPRQSGRPGDVEPDSGAARLGPGDRPVPARDHVPGRADQRHRQPGRVPSDEGADDDADAARPGERRRDALARRPRQRLLRRRHAHAAAVRCEPVVQQLHRGVRRAARPRQHADAAGDAAVHGLPAAGAAAAESDPRARQLVERVAGGGSGLLLRRAALRRHRRRRRRTASTATAATSSTAPRASSAPTAARASKASRRSSRSRTCATSIRRSACSASRTRASSTSTRAATSAIRSAASA